MARHSRIEYPGAVHHVTARGVARQDIFLGSADHAMFLSLVADMCERWGIVVHGYCVMTNHYHIEIESPEGPLSQPVGWLNQNYAGYFNWRQNRDGHVFQGRFKSVVIEANAYLYELTRYIHLNPVRAGIVRRPAEYAWSSYRAFTGLAPAPEWLNTEFTLARFGTDLAEQRAAYRRFVEGSGQEHMGDPIQHAAANGILGTQAFADQVSREHFADEVGFEAVSERGTRGSMGLDEIGHAVAEGLGVPIGSLCRKGQRGNRARDIAIYLAVRVHGHKLREVGRWFGAVKESAVSLACKRVEESMGQDVVLQGLVCRLGQQPGSGL